MNLVYHVRYLAIYVVPFTNFILDSKLIPIKISSEYIPLYPIIIISLPPEISIYEIAFLARLYADFSPVRRISRVVHASTKMCRYINYKPKPNPNRTDNTNCYAT